MATLEERIAESTKRGFEYIKAERIKDMLEKSIEQTETALRAYYDMEMWFAMCCPVGWWMWKVLK